MSMRLPDGFVDEVRAAASIVAVVSAYLPLKKAGASHKGLCPFHTEKTPSFNVNETRGVFHCFGCGAGGDAFAFVMRMESAGFIESVRRVAEHCGIPVPSVERGPADERRERLLQLNELALKAYRRVFASDQGQTARAYLHNRGVSPTATELFELGVTPPGWEGISQELLRQGFAAQDIVAAGIAKERPGGRGIYDRFHDRLVFPIRDLGGRLVGFGGRSLTSQEPKYLNSPETELYRKSDVLYGFHRARDAVRRTEEAVLVEGYLDVIAVYDAGIQEVVASLGTSLTEGHARLLRRFARKVYLAYDGDDAGRKASRRALKVLLPVSIEVAVVEVADGLDPDDLVRQKGADALRQLMASARGIVPFLVDQVRDRRTSGRSGPEAAVQIVNEVLPFVNLLDNPVERAAQVSLLAEAAGVTDMAVREALRRAASERRGELEVKAPEALPTCTEAESGLLMAMLSSHEVRTELLSQLEEDDWARLPSANLFRTLVASQQEGVEMSASSLVARLPEERDRQLLASMAMSSQDWRIEEGVSCLQTLRSKRLQRDLEDLQRQIAAGVAELDLDALLMRKQELSRLLELLR